MGNIQESDWYTTSSYFKITIMSFEKVWQIISFSSAKSKKALTSGVNHGSQKFLP